jgi:hypothetical protein
MGFQTPAETLLDPMTDTVLSGASEDIEVGPCSAFQITRLAASAGTLRFVCRTAAEGAATDATAGHSLTELNPVFGPVPADAVKHVRIYADGGNVVYEIARLRRV